MSDRLTKQQIREAAGEWAERGAEVMPPRDDTHAVEEPDGLTRRRATMETTATRWFRLIIDGCKEHEIHEMMDLLRSRGWIQ